MNLILLLQAAVVTGSDWSDISAIVISLVSAIAAVAALLIGRNESRARLAVEHCRSVLDHLNAVMSLNTEKLQRDLLEWYRTGCNRALTPDEVCYFELLSSLDLMAFATERRTLDKRMAHEYIATLIGTPALKLGFLREIQRLTKDDRVYCHLDRFYQHALSERKKIKNAKKR